MFGIVLIIGAMLVIPAVVVVALVLSKPRNPSVAQRARDEHPPSPGEPTRGPDGPR